MLEEFIHAGVTRNRNLMDSRSQPGRGRSASLRARP
jgi:hypothetical protein